MRHQSILSALSVAAFALVAPAAAHAQSGNVRCADNTIVTSDSACSLHGGVHKAGGLNRVGKEVGKAATDTRKEVERTPKNVEKGAKTAAHDVDESAEHGGNAVSRTAKKVGHGVKEAAGDVSKGAQKAVHPTKFYASCKDGTHWTGRSKKHACRKHGGVTDWTDSSWVRIDTTSRR